MADTISHDIHRKKVRQDPKTTEGWRGADSTKVWVEDPHAMWVLTVSFERITAFVLSAYIKTTFGHLKRRLTCFKERKCSIFELDYGKRVGIS